MTEFHNYKKLKLIPKLLLHQKITSGVFKFFGYGIGILNCLPWMTSKGLGIKPEANRQQSFAYEENGEMVYRRIEAKEELPREFRGMKTVTEIFVQIFKDGGKRCLLGYRRIIKEHILTAGIVKNILLELGEYEWLSCEEVLRRIMTVCEYFKPLGLSQERKIAIFAETSQDWFIIAMAAIFLNSIVVTMYPTLTDDNIFHVLNLTEPVVMVVDSKSSMRIYSMLERLPFIETIIYTSRCHPDIIDRISFPQITHIHIDSVFERSIEMEIVISSLNQPSYDNLIIIMFTSGSTGIPKGIMIKHQNVVGVLAGSETQAETWKNHTTVGYAPLAHIFEILYEMAIIVFGGKIAYGSPTTLFPGGPSLYNGTVNDLALVKPTCMAAVPLVMERVYKKIMEKLKSSSKLKQLIFQESYNLRAYFHSRGFKTPILNKIIFKKFHALFGGDLKFVMVGGAFLSLETEEFFNILFPPFKQAYGTTEICCAGTMSNVSYHRPNNVGPPLACTEIKLVPSIDSLDSQTGLTVIKGEMLISGPAVCCGYYKNEEQTEEAFFTDPITNKLWFRTADIAEILPDGCFRIIGRKSEIIKLGHGEFVELPKIEAAISGSKYVDYVCVIPDDNFSFLTAIISLNKMNVIQLAEELHISQNIEFEQIAFNTKMADEIKENIKTTIKSRSLNKFEIPAVYVLLPDQWTPDTGLLTPTLKIKRLEIEAKYKYVK